MPVQLVSWERLHPVDLMQSRGAVTVVAFHVLNDKKGACLPRVTLCHQPPQRFSERTQRH